MHEQNAVAKSLSTPLCEYPKRLALSAEEVERVTVRLRDLADYVGNPQPVRVTGETKSPTQWVGLTAEMEVQFDRHLQAARDLEAEVRRLEDLVRGPASETITNRRIA